MSNRFRITAVLLLTLFTALQAPAAQAETAPVLNTVSAFSGANPSVLERFRTYTGPRMPDNLIRLFNSPAAADSVLQKPEIVLSDGQTHVALTLKINSTENYAPNFAAIEARLISVKQPQAGVWLLDVLPKAGSWKSAVVVQQGGSASTIALTVAPPLTGDLSLSGFIAYLKASGSDVQQRIDLNGDGQTDFLDDYIYTANVLVVRNADPHDPATRNKRARELTPVRLKH